MFQALGKLVTRNWPILLIVWIGLLIGLKFVAPAWNEVAVEGQFTFLPSDAQSRRAEDLLDQAFPNDRGDSSFVLLLSRTDSTGLTEADRTFIRDQLEPGLRQIAEEEGGLAVRPEEEDEATPSDPSAGGDQPANSAEQNGNNGNADIPPPPADQPESSSQPAKPATGKKPLVARILTPDDRAVGPLLLSRDGQAALVILQLTTEFLGSQNQVILEKVNDLLSRLRQQEVIPDGLTIDYTGSALIGIERRQYQLKSVHEIDRWSIYLVIILLIAVYRAPLLSLLPLITIFVAVRIALRLLALMAQAGWVGLFSGLEVYTTVLVYGAGVDYALFLISRAQEEMERGIPHGPAVKDSVTLVGHAVAASACTVMFGIGMMYFAEFRKFSEAGISIAFGMFIMLLASLLFLPPLLKLTGRWAFWPQRVSRKDFHPDAQHVPGFLERLTEGNLLQRFWDKCGQIVLRHPGLVWLGTIAVMAPFAAVGIWGYDHLSFGLVSDLPRDSLSVKGFNVLAEHFPAGATGPLTVLVRDEQTDFRENEGISLIQQLSDSLQADKDKRSIADLRSVSSPVGWSAEAQKALYKDVKGLQAVTRRGVIKRQAIRHYVSQSEDLGGHVTRLDLIMTVDPFSLEALKTLRTIEAGVRDALPEELKSATVLFSGATASIQDLREVSRSDRVTIQVLVTSVVFVILVILLRGFSISLYLMLTVLLGFIVTLGITYLVFWARQPHDFPGLDWTVVIFLFAVLVAVGIDYNIFLVTRIEEEQQRHGPVLGVTEALVRTGSIISSCGIIMAGTFFSLTVGGSLASLTQLGFALACGILLDTFIVRPFLVPSYLVLLNKGSFGPLGRWLGAKKDTRNIT